MRFVGPLLHQRRLCIIIFLVSLVTASACGTGSSSSTAASSQPPESGNSPTAGFTLRGRSHPPVTVTWVSSLSPTGAPSSPAPSGSSSSPFGSSAPSGSSSLSAEAAVLSTIEGSSDWYTALAYRQCASVLAPPALQFGFVTWADREQASDLAVSHTATC